MAVESYEIVTVAGDFITVDLLVWRRYRLRTRGLTELTMDVNPHLAKLHREGPFIPPGTQVAIPIDPELLKGAPQPKKTVVLYE